MTRPVLACCVPTIGLFPSGSHWAHSRACPDQPSQKVRFEPAATPARRSRDAHPAGLHLGSVDVWRTHAQGCACWDCGYVEHWLDRDDDRGLELAP